MKPLLFNSLLFSLLAAFVNVALPANIQKTEAAETISFPSAVVASEAPSSQKIVVGDKDTKRYYLPGMPYYDKAKEYQRVYFDSEQQATNHGYYKAGTGKDLTDPLFQSGEAEIKQDTPPVAALPVSEKNFPETLQKNEKILEIKKQDIAQAADEPLKPAGEKISEKTVKQETVAEARTLSPVPVVGKENLVVAKANDTPVKIEANSLSYDNERDVYSAAGNVVITYGDSVLTADNVELDRKSNLATAEGGAFLKMAKDTLQGDKIVVNVEDKTGVAYNSKAFYARNHFYVKGDKIEKTGENSYHIVQPLATTCDGDDPAWQLAGSDMKVTIEGYGWVNNARLLTKGVPVVYTPLIAFPAKTKRQTGFLFPYLAYSRDKDGVDIEIPFFWAINPQMDATFYSRYIEKRGFKEGAEFRYFAGSKSFGTLYGDYLEDNKHITENIGDTISRDWQESHKRWSFMANHQTNFDREFYIRTDVYRVSDSWYFRDFNANNYYLTHYAATEEDPFKKVPFQGNESLRFLESSARVFKGWNNYNVMARVSSIDDFAVNNNDRTLQKYPEVIFTGIKQPLLSTPVYFEFAGNYDYFYRGDGAKGHYADFAPTISLPVNISNYAKITPQLTVREIYWDRDDNETNSENRSGSRTVYNAGLTVSSRLSRVFDVNILGWDKVQHEIKPEILYSYMPGVRQDNIPDYLPKTSSLLDSVTSLNIGNSNALTDQNAVAWALTNTITARVKDKTGTNSYLEFLRFKLFQIYDINEAKKDMAGATGDRRPMSDVGIELDLKPHQYFSFSARNQYSPYSGWKEMNYDLGINDWRGDKLTFGYRYTLNSVEGINMDLRAVITERLSGKFVVALDRFNNQTVENTIGLVYTEQCWSVGVDYIKTHDDERIILKISLAGLGMF
jgi:LPS-assembly protein